jgi:hypothetical protein
MLREIMLSSLMIMHITGFCDRLYHPVGLVFLELSRNSHGLSVAFMQFKLVESRITAPKRPHAITIDHRTGTLPRPHNYGFHFAPHFHITGAFDFEGWQVSR